MSARVSTKKTPYRKAIDKYYATLREFEYQVSTDKRSVHTSDPNRDDDEQYIVRLVGAVVRVSVETVKLVNALPPDYTEAPAASPPADA